MRHLLTEATGLLIDGGWRAPAETAAVADKFTGGVKDSGHGVEGPRYAAHDMTDPRIIVLNLKEPS